MLAVTTADIEVFLDTRSLNDRSRCEWISHLSCFYTWTRQAFDLPEINPTEAIMRPKLRRLLPRPISEVDLERALDAARDDRTMRAFLVLGAFAGFRCCEMAWLTGESVLWHEGIINVFGKGRKERTVEIHPLVAGALRDVGVPHRGHVFRRPNGSAWLPSTVSREISDFFSDHDIDATAHRLRHRFGTKTYAACKDLRVVQELLGHASPNTTAVYTAFSRDDARAAVLALPLPTLTDSNEAA